MQIEANLLRTRESLNDLSPQVLGTSRRDLSQWHDQLPPWMHLKVLLEPNQLATGTRRVIFLVHLFYLPANILVARLAHGRASRSRPPYDDESQIAASDGVIAARTAARILQLQLDEQTVYQKCWLCMWVPPLWYVVGRKLIGRRFTSYMSCLVLLHSTAQLALHRYPKHVWQRELKHAESCIKVLEHCGSADKVAHGFATSASRYYELFVVQNDQPNENAMDSDPDDFEYLFSSPVTATDFLAQLAGDLLLLVSNPFGHPTNLHTEGTLKAGFGSQQDWNVFVTLPFNRSVSVPGQATSLEMALSGLQDGQFVGSPSPHGWGSLTNDDDM